MKKIIIITTLILVIVTGALIGIKTIPTLSPSNTITAIDLLNKFKQSNLNVTNDRKMTVSDLGMAPKVTDEAYIFTVENDKNARLFEVKNSSDLNNLKKYYDDLGVSSALLYSHTFSKGNFLLQMNGEISEELFNKYTEILKNNL